MNGTRWWVIITSIIYFLLFTLYAVFSFSLTDPNLVLTSWAPYWSFQQNIWHSLFLNATLLTQTYTALIFALFVGYGLLIIQLKKQKKTSFASLCLLLTLFLLPLFFSMNALSHDVFNYMFNAKMLVQYHANPHVQTALQFANDPWVRFMHNIHTPAPYGYGWTYLSILPFVIGHTKFTFTWLLFRLMSVISLSFLVISYGLSLKTKQASLIDIAVVLFNPLLLIEMISNSHNDLWMMAPALAALLLVAPQKKAPALNKVILSLILLALSISIKLVTITLLPLWIFLLLFHWKVFARLHQSLLKANKHFAKIYASLIEVGVRYWAELTVLCLFIPLTTDRSQQFHPWYLTWLLVWIPFLRLRWLRMAILVLSVSSLFRYIPWLMNGGFTDQIIWQQKMITWIPLGVFLLWSAALHLGKRNTVQ